MSFNSLNIETVFLSIICLSLGLHMITAEHAQIGNYQQVTMDDCGTGEVPDKVDDNCFKWNKLNDSESSLVNGRPALPDEVPFVVPIFIWKSRKSKDSKGKIELSELELKRNCTGTILNANWVLTCEKCVNIDSSHSGADTYHYVVYPGAKDFIEASKSEITYRTTEYFNVTRGQTWNRLALLKYETPFDFGYKKISSVCLPSVNNIVNNPEYALISGFGHFEDKTKAEWRLDKAKQSTNLYIGWIQIKVTNSQKVSVSYPIPFIGQPGCIMASCSPVVKYVDQKAVLIAMNIYELNGCPYDKYTSLSLHRMSYFIDEIVKIIQQNSSMPSD